MQSLILDTDIGTDVDDTLALAVLLGSPEIELLGVTTVHANVTTRSRMVQKILRLHGRNEVPVFSGTTSSLMGYSPPYWEGHEGEGLLETDDVLPPLVDTHAVDFMIEMVIRRPGEITLLAVGPLTNVAMAIRKHPAFARSLNRLVVMGGLIATHTVPDRRAEHNMWLDPEAAHIVFTSGAHIELVPLDVTLKVEIDVGGVASIERVGTTYHRAIARQVSLYPPFGRRGGRTFLHDPLAALAVVRPDLLNWMACRLDIELEGRISRAVTVAQGADEANAAVAMTVDPLMARDEIIRRICAEVSASNV